MSDAIETTGPTDSPVRSTTSVLLLLAGLVAVPVLVLLALLVLRGGDNDASTGVVGLVDGDRVQAVYLTNDLVFFGRMREGEGDFFVLEDAFFLRDTPIAAADEDEGDTEAGGVQLVPVSEGVGGDGDLVINAAEVVRVQDLESDAEIATSIEDATK